jgi:orotate phosphoribosyltransferase-like protein
MAGTLLTLQQLKAIELLSDGKRSQQSIADEIGVSRRTIVRWLADQEFQEALKGVGTNQFVVNPEVLQPQQSPVSIRHKLNSLAVTVVEQVEAILTDPEAEPLISSKRLNYLENGAVWMPVLRLQFLRWI